MPLLRPSIARRRPGIGFGTGAVGWDNLVYGVLLVLFIIFLPRGILGSFLEGAAKRRARPTPAAVQR